MDYKYTHCAPRFGNALVGETLFRMEGVSADGAPLPPADAPAWGTEFPSQVRSQTEFGNEDGL